MLLSAVRSQSRRRVLHTGIRLAHRATGRFHRDHDDPWLGCRTAALGGAADRDHPTAEPRRGGSGSLAGSWDKVGPRHRSTTSARADRQSETTCRPTDLILAEGIFAANCQPAARVRPPCTAPVRAQSTGSDGGPPVRARDLKERCKPPLLPRAPGVELTRRRAPRGRTSAAAQRPCDSPRS